VANEVEIGLAGAGETNLNLLKSHQNQLGKHCVLAVHVHGIDQRLVAVAQVDAAPARRAG
jgi:hypothetical protein